MKTRRSEAGQVTPFVAIVFLALLLCAGLVVDGGRILTARRQAADVAAGAARAGAQAVSIEDLRASNAQRLDVEGARAAALDYLAQTGRTGEVEVAGDTVTVRVRLSTSMVILGLAGMADKTVTGTGTARTVRGVRGPDA